ncbi:MAG: FtsX-like permease family protein [Gammaproteobacteria bacterium]
MSRLVRRAGRRAFARHPWQYVLAVAGVALGVAVVLGVDLAGASARKAFDVSRELVMGRATHQVVPLGTELDESIYLAVRRAPGVRAAAPVVEAGIGLPGDRRATLLGIDPFAEGPFREEVAAASGAVDVGALLVEPGAVALPARLADALQAEVGDRFTADTPSGPADLLVAGIIETDPGREAALAGFVYADIATAQELLGMVGRLSRVDLILEAGQAAGLAGLLPASAELVETAARSSATYAMTRAFRVNLTALSLLALLVGAFLIYGTLTFLVLRRTRTLGVLRSMGVDRRGVAASVLSEALMVGVPGTVLGLALGAALGLGLAGLVVQTMDDLYFRLRVSEVSLTPWPFAKAAALGVVTSLVSALGPALEAAGMPPRAVLSRASVERRARRRLPRLAAAAVACAVLAAVLLALGRHSLVVSFAGLFAVFLAAALATPPVTAWLMAGLDRLMPAAAPLPLRMAVRGTSASLSRTGVAVSALSVAVATVIGVGVMVGSFRSSVEQWLSSTLVADFYLHVEDSWCRAREGLDDLVDPLLAVPGVAEITYSQRRRLPTAGEDIRLWAVDGGSRGLRAPIIAGDPGRIREQFGAGEAVMVSEPWAARRGTRVGDRVTLPTPVGPRTFPVAGIFRDYTSDRGVVALHRDAYRRLWNDSCAEGLGVVMAPDAEPDRVRAGLAAAVPAESGIPVTANADLRSASLAVFDRTFTVTRVLQLLVGIVAFLGMLSALQALQLERVRENAVLRAVGWLPRQLRSLVLTQTGLLGLAAGLFAVPVGLALAGLLVFVINRRAFGWTMSFDPSVQDLVQGVLLAVGAALLAGVYPAWQAVRRQVAQDLREE